jgi:hypothetical protein
MTLCEPCHNEIHNDKKQYKKVKTTNGYSLKEVKINVQVNHN